MEVSNPQMRVLFLNHTGAVSGAEHVMMRLLDHLPVTIERAVACPPETRLSEMVRERGTQQYGIPGTDVSFALGPVSTPRGVAELARSAFALRSVVRDFDADLIHANSTRAGLIAIAARAIGGPPVVVQCHDNLPRSRNGKIVRRVLAGGARAVLTPSHWTADEFNRGLPSVAAQPVYVSIDHSRFSPSVAEGAPIRAELGLPDGAHVLVHVAQISPWKGQETSIKALARIREHLDAHLLVVGDVAFQSRRFDNEAYARHLRRLVDELAVAPAVHFLGFRSDIPNLMAAADLVLLPSWDEPFGTAVLEGMAVGTPALVTSEGGVRELVEGGLCGRALRPRDPALWAETVLELLSDAPVLERMGVEAARVAERFTDARYVEGVTDAYVRALGSGS
jgi:glycosyltransferase involved in cell wall biosynthesis